MSILSACAGDPAIVQEELSVVKHKYDTDLDNLKNRETQLDKVLRSGLHLQEEITEIQSWIAESTETMEAWQPVSTDPDTANKQLQELKVYEP